MDPEDRVITGFHCIGFHSLSNDKIVDQSNMNTFVDGKIDVPPNLYCSQARSHGFVHWSGERRGGCGRGVPSDCLRKF